MTWEHELAELAEEVAMAEETALAELAAFGSWEPFELRSESERMASRAYREECLASFGAMSDKAIAEVGSWDSYLGCYR